MFVRFAAAVGIVALVGSLCAPARAFDIADARRIVSLAEPQISPDGAWVAYIRGKADFEKDRTDRQIWLLNVRTHRQRQLTYDRKGIFGLGWSRDGRILSFAALDGGEKNPQEQIFELRMDGGEARQVTHAKNGVNSYAMSNDGRRYAYTTQDSDPNRKQIDAHLDAFQVRDNDYLHRSATPPVHLWVIDADGSRNKQLTKGDWSVANVEPDGGGDLSWSADDKRIAFERFPTPFVGNSLDSYIETADSKTGAIARLNIKESLQNSPIFAPQGQLMAYVRNTNGDFTQGIDLYVAGANGAHVADLRKVLDRNVDGMVWNAAGDALWVQTPHNATVSLWYWSLKGGIVRANLGDVQVGSLGNVARNGTLVFTGGRNDHPGEIYVIAGPNAKPVGLTDLNGFVASTGVARSVEITWKSTKGNFKEDGVLTYPLHYKGGKAPLVLIIHGGPQGSSTLAWSSQRQEFAAHGFFTFSPNYRGSTNLGDAYQHAITNDAGDGPGKDVMAGVAAVEKLGVIDTSRIGVSGWSYGGYMTSWLIGNFPNVWKAAVSGASLDDWLDDYNIAFYYDTDVPFFRGKPWDPKNTAEWREQSPITYAPNAKAPTLVMGDIGDNNVTITNSFKLYHALKDNGTPVQFVAYPVAGHFPSDPLRSEDVGKRWLAWFVDHLK